MARGRSRGRIFKETASIWTMAGLPWAFVCYGCGRRGHHITWARAMHHSRIHDCAPKSLW